VSDLKTRVHSFKWAVNYFVHPSQHENHQLRAPGDLADESSILPLKSVVVKGISPQFPNCNIRIV
jgi:hypothetical protein